MTKCDPKLQKELDHINNELAVERQLDEIAEESEVKELFKIAVQHGSSYAQGYMDGFWAGYDLLLDYIDARQKSIKQKHDELSRRWGLDEI